MFEERLDIRAYDQAYGATVARWVKDRQELFWLAPNTIWPLTGDKVTSWVGKSADRPMLLYQVGREMPCGYAELNALRDSTCHLWIGHVIIDPAQRYRGLGRRLVQMLVEHALADQAIQRLTMVVFPDNVAALGCYDAIGFRIVGREHHRFASDNEKHTMLRLELTRRRARSNSLALAAGQ